MILDKDILRESLLKYLKVKPTDLNILAAQIGIGYSTMRKFIHGGNIERFSVISKINNFIDSREFKIAAAPLSVMQICNLHNRLRALRGNTQEHIDRLLESMREMKVPVYELNELRAAHYAKIEDILKRMEEAYGDQMSIDVKMPEIMG